MSEVYIGADTRMVVGKCKAREIREQFRELKAFMQRLEAGG